MGLLGVELLDETVVPQKTSWRSPSTTSEAAASGSDTGVGSGDYPSAARTCRFGLRNAQSVFVEKRALIHFAT